MEDSYLETLDLRVAGRPLISPWDRLRRYCGLPWSGGAGETWAYRYYDAVDTDPAVVGPVDVLATAALHPRLSRQDLAYFHDNATHVNQWLAAVPSDVPLRSADDATLRHLDGLLEWPDAPSLSLLTKVLHRKRPDLIPLVDRHILDWYRPIMGERSATAAWPALLRALQPDLDRRNALHLAFMNVTLETLLGRAMGHLRVLDISIWMAGRV